jgi:thioredoxin 1
MIGPSVEALATEFEGKAKVFKLDIDAYGDIASQYDVMSIPTLLVFKGGKVVDKMVGAFPKPQIAQLITRNI